MSTDPLEQGLVCEDELPLDWEQVDALPSSQRIAAFNVSNEALIRAREGLEEPPRSSEESPDLVQELQRVESKLNLVLELLADWLRRQDDMPPALPVRFNGRGLSWESAQGPPVGALVRLNLYVCTSFPKPLVAFGRVLRQEDRGHATMTVLEFMALSQSVVDGLERLVFRRHRREVAQMRGTLRAGPDTD